MQPNVHRSTVYNSQDVEATYLSTDREMDKEDAVCIYVYIPHTHTHTHIHTHTMEHYSAIKSMKYCHLQQYGWTQRLILSEISQRRRNII